MSKNNRANVILKILKGTAEVVSVAGAGYVCAKITHKICEAFQRKGAMDAALRENNKGGIEN